MFCSGCGWQINEPANFCAQCGKAVKGTEIASLGPASVGSTASSAVDTNTSGNFPKPLSGGQSVASAGKVRSFSLSSYRKMKAATWKSKVSRTPAGTKEEEVSIRIALFELSDKEQRLKVLRGKRMALRVSNQAPYCDIRDLAVMKWKNYHSDCFQEGVEYVLLYEDGKCAQFLPGTVEFLTLRKYKEEIGKDYKGIVLYLCTEDDFNLLNGLSKYESESQNGANLKEQTTVHMDTIVPSPEDPCDSLQYEKAQSFNVDVSNPLNKNDAGCGDSSASTMDSFVTADFMYMPSGLSETEAVEEAIRLSLRAVGDYAKPEEESKQPIPEEELSATIKSHANKVVFGPSRTMVVSRPSVWATAKPYFQKKRFIEQNGLIEVTFAAFEQQEDAADLGGPRRELFHLLLAAICKESRVVIGTTKGHVVKFNLKALQDGDYKAVGTILATLIMQGGEPPRIFSPSICQYIASRYEGCKPALDEIPDAAVRTSLEKIMKASDQNQIDQVLEMCDWRFYIEGLFHNVSVSNRNIFVDEVAKYYVIIKCQTMLDQLIAGLGHYQVFNLIEDNPGMAEHLFLYKEMDKLTGKQLQLILKPHYSPRGSNRRPSEEIVFTKFLDFVNCAEDGTLLEDLKESFDDMTEEEVQFIPKITPGHILMFCTGSAQVPVTGFDPKPSVSFVHDNTKQIPSAQTCANMLHLFVNDAVVNGDFQRHLVTALMNGAVFSKI